MAVIKLTERSLETLRIEGDEAQAYFWDSELVGFGVVVGRTGVRTFVARASVKGKKQRIKIGIAGRPRADGHPWNVASARLEARKLIGRMTAGEDLRPSAQKEVTTGGVPTLREALEIHIGNLRTGRNKRRRVGSPRTIDKLQTEVSRHLAAWLDKPITALTSSELLGVCKRIERETPKRIDAVNPAGRAQANKIIAHVGALWNASDWHMEGRLAAHGRNPAKWVLPGALEARTVRIDDESAGRVGGMTFATWHATVQTLSPMRRDLQLVSLFTGVRADGLRHLRWEDVNEERRTLHIARSKGDKPYTLPLVETVREILARRRSENRDLFAPFGGDTGFVFATLTQAAPFRVIPIQEVKEWRTDRRSLDETGRPTRTRLLPGIHANRRTYNSIALEIGVHPEARLALLNHKSPGVNARHYSQVQDRSLIRDAAERIEAALRERLGMPPLTQEGGADIIPLRAARSR